MADDLDLLLAKQAITEQLCTYCRAFDRLDDELALTVWHPGGTVRYGDGPVQPVAEYLPPSKAVRRSMNNCSHQLTNILIRVRGQCAVSEAYVTASLQEEPVDGRTAESLYRGRYIDRWSCRNGTWAIDHRWFVPDSYTRIEFANPYAGSGFLGMARRDREDPSYLAFAELEDC
jgi:hypothetical protein